MDSCPLAAVLSGTAFRTLISVASYHIAYLSTTYDRGLFLAGTFGKIFIQEVTFSQIHILIHHLQ
jgi:hypothetical protein